MIKKGVFCIILGAVLIGCKAKKRATYSKKKSTEKVVKRTRTEPKAPKYEDNGYYALPADNGTFVRFTIHSVEEYIATFSEIAQMEMKAYGIPASITLAQGLLESGLGKGALALKTNNHFGIKCHKGWEGDRDYHDDDEKGECFRKYNHPMYSFRDHSIFLSSRSRYASLFELDTDDYRRWAKGLKQAGYATDRKYPQKLIALIERHRLYEYDVLDGSRKNVQESVEDAAGRLVYTVKKGDTLYSISRRHDVSVAALKELNRMEGNTISIGQELTIRPSRVHK